MAESSRDPRPPVLIAEDDPASRRLLEVSLSRWGYEVVVTADGAEAWRALQRAERPMVAVLDWMMPEMDGLEVCRQVRAAAGLSPPYLVLLTAKGRPEDIVAGFEAGADDYIVKPFDRDELRARVRVGARMIALQETLADRVRALEEALVRVRQLQGLLPMCSYCKKVRNDQNYWQRVEAYIADRSDARFTHEICPDCYRDRVRPELDQLRRDREERGSA